METLAQVLFMSFSKFVRTVSIVVKVNLAHETVNYNTEIKTPIWARKVNYQEEWPRRKSKFNSCFRRRSPE